MDRHSFSRAFFEEFGEAKTDEMLELFAIIALCLIQQVSPNDADHNAVDIIMKTGRIIRNFAKLRELEKGKQSERIKHKKERFPPKQHETLNAKKRAGGLWRKARDRYEKAKEISSEFAPYKKSPR